MKQEHQCPPLAAISKDKGVAIKIMLDEDEWVLCYRLSLLHEDDVSGKPKYRSDILSEVSLAIEYCPYCGEKL